MVIKVFCGKEFSEHEHEWKQFKEVYGLINEHYANSNKSIYILSDFLLSNAQIDVVILTQKGPAILELKSYKGEIFGSENGDWCVKTEDNQERLLNVNLFQQLKDQRFAFLEKLNSIRIGNFEHVDVEKLAHIQCWGYFEKGSNYDIEQVGRGVRIWFDVITANNLIEKMMRSLNAGYLLRPEDMDAIVEGLNLKEYADLALDKMQVTVSPQIPEIVSQQDSFTKKLESLLKNDKNQWIKNNLLPLLGLLNLTEENLTEMNYKFFTLPLSKENLIDNLVRITNIHRTIIVDKLSQFEQTFEDYIEIISENYTYFTPSSKANHPPSRNPCPDPENSTKYYILKPELAELSKKELEKIAIDPPRILNEILHNVRTIEDLLYLSILKKTSEVCKSQNKYLISTAESIKTEPLKTAMQVANIDESIINYCFKHNLDFEFKINKFQTFLPKNYKLFALFYSHKFNTSSCTRCINIALRNDLAQYFYDYLEKIHIEKILEKNYTNIKHNMMIQEERLPLFECRNEHSKFVEKYYSKFTSNEPLYRFVIEDYFDKSLEFLKDNGIIEINDDEIILLSEDKFRTFRNEKYEIELKRINKNKNELLIKWLRSGVNIQVDPSQDSSIEVGLLINSLASIVTVPHLKISGTAYHPNGIESVTINTEPAGTESWSRTISLENGKNLITVIAKSKTGEVKSEQLIVQYNKETSKKNLNESIVIGSTELPKQWGILGESNNKKVILDLNAPHICFIAGMMGAGKGYTIGVISEMLASQSIPEISEVTTRATVIVLYKPKDDVPSEFWSIRFANDNQQEIQGLKAHDTVPKKLIEENQFKVFLDPGVYSKYRNTFSEDYHTDNIFPLYIDPSTLIAEDWKSSLAIGDGSDALYIKKLFKILRSLTPTFSINDVIKSINSSDLTKSQKGLALARLDILEEYFNKEDFINNLAIGGVNIIDFRKCMYQPDDIFTIMTLIISKLQNKNDFEKHPFVFVMNEAHMYFKRGISKEFLDTIENLIRRKRHGANWLLLDTHLPTDVDSKVIELSDIKILHYTDKTVESTVFKRILEDSKEKLHELERGECIVFSTESSEGLSKAIKVKVRPRITKHGGETKTAI